MIHYTDIITFTLSGKLTPIIAEIYISVERVQENSHFFKCQLSRKNFAGL